MTINIGDLVGKRVLLKVGTGVQEYRIIEVSPSGVWIKLMNLYGNKFWRPLADLYFIEELREIKPIPREENAQ